MITSQIVYLGELSTKAEHLKSGIKIITDAPVDNNGKGEAFSPTDLAATSLASCSLTIIGIKSKKEEIDFTGTTVDLTKTMSKLGEGPRKITKISMVFNFTPRIDRTKQELFEEYAKTCPVALSLHPEIEQEYIFNWK